MDNQNVGRSGAWQFLLDGEIRFPDSALVYALGRLGDVYGPLPVEMFHPDAWGGNMLHASHDLVAVRLCPLDWRDAFPNDAIAIEARSGETAKTGSTEGESAGLNEASPNTGAGETNDRG
jgi:hypothetical protein